MPDRSISRGGVAMLCGEPPCLSRPLPEGYRFTRYRPGMEDAWCTIQCSARVFPGPADARRLFDRELEVQPELLARRMLFVCDPQRRAVGTAALWRRGGMEEVRWMAVTPGMRGQGLGKALAAKLMEVYREEGCTGGICLTARTSAYQAVNIFRELGFTPDRGERFLDQPQSEEAFTAAWRAVGKRIADYAGGRGADAAEGVCRAFVCAAGDAPRVCARSQVWYVVRGGCRHETEGQVYEMKAGDAFFVPPQAVHRTTIRDGGSAFCCEFDMDKVLSRGTAACGQMQEIAENVSFVMLLQRELFHSQPKLTFSREGQRQMERLMQSMLEESGGGEKLSEDFLQLQVLQLLLILAREYGRLPAPAAPDRVHAKYRAMVEAAVAYIDEHFSEPLTLNDMCRVSTLSKTYFCSIFKLLTHKTFTEYLMERRVERAMALLRETDLPVAEVGRAVGFRESTHFSRTFKKLRGVSPREYRASARRRT